MVDFTKMYPTEKSMLPDLAQVLNQPYNVQKEIDDTARYIQQNPKASDLKGANDYLAYLKKQLGGALDTGGIGAATPPFNPSAANAAGQTGQSILSKFFAGTDFAQTAGITDEQYGKDALKAQGAGAISDSFSGVGKLFGNIGISVLGVGLILFAVIGPQIQKRLK